MPSFDNDFSPRGTAQEIVDQSTQTSQDGRHSLERQQRRGSESPQPFEVDTIEDSPMGFENPLIQPLVSEDEIPNLATQITLANRSSNLNEVFNVKTLYPGESCVELYLPANPRELPPPRVAAALLKYYRETVHKWLPILSSDFETQLLAYCTIADVVPSQCLAITNLVFAIGAQYALLVNDAQCLNMNGCLDHHVYISRALKSLELRSSSTWASKPNIVVVQVSYQSRGSKALLIFCRHLDSLRLIISPQDTSRGNIDELKSMRINN